MKITKARRIFSGQNLYVQVETDEGITGLGECTLNTRQLAVAGALEHLEPVLAGQDPFRIEHIWQDIFRGTFWRGGPVLMAALSGIDAALWDIKGKALNTPVYNLLGGACRDRIRVYCHAGGSDLASFLDAASARLKQGYTVLRICPHDAHGGFYEPGPMVRKSVEWMGALRREVGEAIEIIFEIHTRLSVPRAAELINAIEEFRPMFVEDPLRADAPEAFRALRERVRVPLGTGEKYGAKWDYRAVIENDLIDYVRSDICNCGGITEMKKIAALAEAHYMEMVPHGLPSMAGMMAALHLDLATPNFLVQEAGLFGGEPRHLTCDFEYKDGWLYLGDSPGLGITLHEEHLTPFTMREHPHLRREDGTVQDW